MWDESITERIEAAFETPGPHGGPKETALIQHLAGDLVHDDRLEQARDGGLANFDEETGRVHGARTFYDALDNSQNGVFGDQTDASDEVGAELFDAALDHLCRLCDWLDDRTTEELLPKEHV
nr:creatininase family protein [Halomicroarcula sp. ZS-22-S1]